MSQVKIRNITATVEGSDLWRAESKLGADGLRSGITAAVESAVRVMATSGHRSLSARVAELHRAGLCDALIAGELNVVKYRVGDIRRRLGLEPNRCHRSGGRRQ
ncbi:MAG TPA: hypothetical protein VNR37_03370 [Microbacteriaceae bacterium]|nr:hypothetical protein [Microbacteriaceae bacterium]